MRLGQLEEVIERARAGAAEAAVPIGRIGVLKNAWVTDGTAREAQRMNEAIASNTREYAGSWWMLQGQLGFDAPELLDKQMERAIETAFVGPADSVAGSIRELAEIGVDLVVLHVSADFTRPAYRENMRKIATDVVPLL
jgi:hypothetical protein